MKALLLFVALAKLAAGVPQTPGLNASTECKVLSSDSNWPSPEAWKAALPDVLQRQPSTTGAKHPDYSLRAESIKDVRDAVKFCAKNRIRLSIITSGHDFLARNDAPSGLSLDMSLIGGVRLLESFTPTEKGAEKPLRTPNTIIPVPGKQAAVTFGAGMPMQRINNAIFPSNLFIIGAAHGSVSVAGGWGLSGGHGPLTHKYGLGVDQFLEFKVVTADGDVKVANEVSHPDLFWALRGGGGGTFGVVVEATVKAYPNEPITATDFVVSSSAYNSDGLLDAYTYFASQMPAIVKKGISGYFYLELNRIRTLMIHPGNISGTANAQSFWNPILDKMASFPTMKKAEVGIYNYHNFKAYFDQHFGAIDKATVEECPPDMQKRHGPGSDMAAPMPGGVMPLDSRLLGAAHLTSPDFKAAIKAAGARIQGHLIYNPDLKYENTSVLPAWRKAYAHMIGTRIGNIISVDSLRKLAPDMGAYVNEAYFGEESWKETFWGSNYPKLSEVKNRYDPDMVFWSTPGINADLMEVRDGRLCKVATPSVSRVAPKSDNQNSPRAMAGAINVAGYGTQPKGAKKCNT